MAVDLLTWTGELSITNEYVHHYAEAVLDRFPELVGRVRAATSGTRTLQCSLRRSTTREYLGITAASLNASLKKSFHAVGGWRFEATVADGAISDSVDLGAKVEGFDLASYDERHNLANLWSLCFGRRPLHNGGSVWRRAIAARPDYAALAEEIVAEGQPGTDLQIEKRAPTIFGEIQFGNWALAYRDLMKLLAATTEVPVDVFVYVTAAGELAEMLSGGIVTYTKTADILDRFAAVVNVPTWLVGLDFASPPPTLDQLTAPLP